MGIERHSTYSQIEKKQKFFDERLRVLFNLIFEKPDIAFKKWREIVAKQGFEKALKSVKKKSKKLGRLQGRSFVQFYKSENRKNAELALDEFFKVAKSWHLATLEANQVEQFREQEKLQEQLAKNDQMIEQTRETITEWGATTEAWLGNNKMVRETRCVAKERFNAQRFEENEQQESQEEEQGQQC